MNFPWINSQDFYGFLFSSVCSVETDFILTKRAKKWLFFSDAVATRNGLLVKLAIELWSPTIRYNPSVNIPPYQRAGQEHHHKKTCTRYEMTLKKQQSFSSYAFYVRIAVIITYATPLWELPSITRRLLTMTVERSPMAGLDATAAHIPTHRPLLLLPEDTLPSSLNISENVVYAIKRRTCNKIHMGNWETLRWPFSTTFTLQAITWHRPPRWPPLYIPSSQRLQ